MTENDVAEAARLVAMKAELEALGASAGKRSITLRVEDGTPGVTVPDAKMIVGVLVDAIDSRLSALGIEPAKREAA